MVKNMRMNRIKSIMLLGLLLTIWGYQAMAQEFNEDKGLLWSKERGLEYRLKAGVSIGGTAPLPLPEEIREIEKYNPMLSISIEANVLKFLHERWALMLAMRFENKGMSTQAQVKNYHMVMDKRNDDNSMSHLEGAWTGHVKTKVKNSYMTVPLSVVYRLTSRWELRSGPFLSYLLSGSFDGTAFDGYLRENDPTGEKVEVSTAVYDFSGDLRKLNWGMMLGGEWKAYKHLNLYADLSWGFNSVFKKDFKSIAFKMYNIYGNIGFGYVF